METIPIGEQEKTTNSIYFCGVSNIVLLDNEIYDNRRWYSQLAYSTCYMACTLRLMPHSGQIVS